MFFRTRDEGHPTLHCIYPHTPYTPTTHIPMSLLRGTNDDPGDLHMPVGLVGHVVVVVVVVVMTLLEWRWLGWRWLLG
jgi:hypothetical protein